MTVTLKIIELASGQIQYFLNALVTFVKCTEGSQIRGLPWDIVRVCLHRKAKPGEKSDSNTGYSYTDTTEVGRYNKREKGRGVQVVGPQVSCFDLKADPTDTPLADTLSYSSGGLDMCALTKSIEEPFFEGFLMRKEGGLYAVTGRSDRIAIDRKIYNCPEPPKPDPCDVASCKKAGKPVDCPIKWVNPAMECWVPERERSRGPDGCMPVRCRTAQLNRPVDFLVEAEGVEYCNEDLYCQSIVSKCGDLLSRYAIFDPDPTSGQAVGLSIPLPAGMTRVPKTAFDQFYTYFRVEPPPADLFTWPEGVYNSLPSVCTTAFPLKCQPYLDRHPHLRFPYKKTREANYACVPPARSGGRDAPYVTISCDDPVGAVGVKCFGVLCDPRGEFRVPGCCHDEQCKPGAGGAGESGNTGGGSGFSALSRPVLIPSNYPENCTISESSFLFRAPSPEAPHTHADSDGFAMMPFPAGVQNLAVYWIKPGGELRRVERQTVTPQGIEFYQEGCGLYQVLADPLPQGNEAFSQVYVYPNPAKNGQKPTLHVEGTKAVENPTVQIFSSSGNIVFHKKIDVSPEVNNGRYVLDYVMEESFAPGVYYGVITYQGQTKVFRFSIV